jgi:hypothetical protein
MIKANALYIVIVITLVIGILCSSIITVSYYQRLHVQHNHLIKRIHDNAKSGINLLLADVQENTGSESVIVDLYGEERDSVMLTKSHWGVFDIANVKAFANGKSTTKSIIYGYKLGTESNLALYLADQNQQLALAGKTLLKGICFLPESGVKRAYIEGENFTGTDLIDGQIQKSKPILPALNKSLTDYLSSLVSDNNFGQCTELTIDEKDTISNSFSEKTILVNCNSVRNISKKNFEGNVILYSSTVIEIDSSNKLSDVIIVAPSVVFKNYFTGSIQAFCTDSMYVEEGCKLNYPSSLGLIKKDFKTQQPFIRIKEKSTVAGIVFSFVDVQDLLKTRIAIDRDALVEGQVYSDGFVDLKGIVLGTVWTNKFILKTPSSIYENHLLNATIDRSKLSDFFVGSSLIGSTSNKQIVKWLE